MLFLSNASIKYAVDICQEKEKYKVGVAIKDEDKRNIMRQLILDIVADSDCVETIRNSKHNFEICFKNRSRINFIFPSDSAKMNRLHLLIADRNISIDVMQCILKPLENLEWLEYVYEEKGIKDSF